MSARYIEHKPSQNLSDEYNSIRRDILSALDVNLGLVLRHTSDRGGVYLGVAGKYAESRDLKASGMNCISLQVVQSCVITWRDCT